MERGLGVGRGRILLLFPGQGSQSVGMGRHLWETYAAARDTFREAEDILGWDLRGLCLNGPIEELTRTDRAQVAIFVTSVAAWRVLDGRGLRFLAAMGHSLGEYSALVATGQLTFADALRVVERRGRAMWACGKEKAGTMAAVVGLPDAQVEQICAAVAGVWPANYNCPGQVVVSGTPASVEKAGRLALERGARRVLPLQVSGAFHSPLVAGAAEELARVLEEVDVGPPARGRFFSTTEVRYPEPEEVKAVMIRQLTSPVRFTQSLQALAGDVAVGIEVGPGGVLAGLAKRVSARLPVYGTDTGSAFEDVLSHISAG
ncbi:MAG: ACP S-malonyltransferase [Thermoleophilia bacterium]